MWVTVKYLVKTELRFWDLLGGRVDFRLETHLRAIRHRNVVLFNFLCLVAVVAADPTHTSSVMPIWAAVLVWALFFVAYDVITLVCFGLAAVATRAMPRLRIPLPLITCVVLLPLVVIFDQGLIWATDTGLPGTAVAHLTAFLLIFQCLETIFWRFIFPDVKKDCDVTPNKPRRHLVVGGEKVDMSRLLHIEAREHHVHLTFDDAKSRARARISDIVAQTKDEDGLQPHRSWWIARDSAIKAERKNGRLILKLRDNTEVPVARTRVEDVMHWLQIHVHRSENPDRAQQP